MQWEPNLFASAGAKEMMLDNIRTHDLESKTDIYEAVRLTKKYCAYPVRVVDIHNQLKADRWCQAKLLTDIVKDVKNKNDEGERVPVAFAMFIEFDKYTSKRKIKPRDLPKILGVRYFAVEPWFDVEVAVKWVKYLIGQIREYRREYVCVNWLVDEYDTPLQEALHNEGFKAIKTIKSNSDTLFNTGDPSDYLYRILFTLD